MSNKIKVKIFKELKQALEDITAHRRAKSSKLRVTRIPGCLNKPKKPRV